MLFSNPLNQGLRPRENQTNRIGKTNINFRQRKSNQISSAKKRGKRRKRGKERKGEKEEGKKKKRRKGFPQELLKSDFAKTRLEFLSNVKNPIKFIINSHSLIFVQFKFIILYELGL